LPLLRAIGGTQTCHGDGMNKGASDGQDQRLGG
jgi:hypothetical protein